MFMKLPAVFKIDIYTGMQLETPAMMARKFGHTDIAEMLSQVGGR